MPRNSSGTYTLPSGNPVVSGTLIEASWANTTLSDLASSMTDSLSRSGEGGMTAALRLYDGTVSLPGLAFSNETSTGLYRASAGDMRLAVTGSQVVQFLNTGVAVTGTLSASGAATLSSTLAVTGASTFTGAATFNATTTTFENSTAYYPQLINRNKTADANGSYIVLEKVRNTSIVQNGDVLGNLIFRGYDGAAYLQGAYINALVSATPGTNDMPTDLVFGTTPDGSAGPSERVRITQAGNVGMGTSSPQGNLALKAASGNTNFAIESAASSRYFISVNNTSNYLAIGGNGSTAPSSGALNIDSSGNVGIGTSSPNAKLYVASSATQAIVVGQGTIGTDYGIGRDNSNGALTFYGNQTGAVSYIFSGVNGERARIDTSGNLLVGTTSVASTGAGTHILNLKSSGASTVWGVGPTTSFGNFYVKSGSGTGVVLTSSATSWASDSDERKKTTLTPFVNAAAKVTTLRAGTGRYLTDEETVSRSFLIAQDVRAVLPEAVDVGEDEDQTLMLRYTDLIPLLTAAIQEQQAIIEGLTARITALEATP